MKTCNGDGLGGFGVLICEGGSGLRLPCMGIVFGKTATIAQSRIFESSTAFRAFAK